MSIHQVLVDDTNPGIQYSGPWFIAQNTRLNTGTNGPPFQNTLHGVNVNASFSYSFSGSQVIVLGTSMTKAASRTPTQDPTWECFVDNISIGWGFSAGAGSENNWVFCQSDLHDGPHVLSINVTVLDVQTFWFDQIQYIPSSNVPLDSSTVRVDSSDPAILYSSGSNPIEGGLPLYGPQWKELDSIVNFTQVAGSTVTYQFFGVSLSWIGFIPSQFSLINTSANYSVDGQSPISFIVPALSTENAPQLYNQIFFETESMSPGQHELIVTYQGNAGTAPLALDDFVVQNASASVPSSTSNLGSTKSPPAGIITGVVVGVTVLVLLLLLYIVRCRRNNRRAQNLNTNPEHYNLSNQNHTPGSDVPFLVPQSLSSQFSPGREPANVPSSASPPVGGPGIDPTNPAIGMLSQPGLDL